MRLYIESSNRLVSYDLPEIIDENVLFKYDKVYLNIVSENGSWFLKNDSSVCVNNEDKVKLNPYSSFPLKIKNENDLLYLHVVPIIEENQKYVAFNGLSTISIGNDTNCDISLSSNLISAFEASLTFKDNSWYIFDSNAEDNFRIYVNQQRVINKRLKTGDIIFMGGLKIIWMGNYMKINNPGNRVLTSSKLQIMQDGPMADNSQFTPTNPDEEIVFNEEDYFFHKPRLRTIVEEKEIIIEAPPNSYIKEDVPFILSIGSSLTMIAFSGISFYNAYQDYTTGTKTVSQIIPSVILSITMIIGSIIMPRLLKAYQNKMMRKMEEKRQKRYTDYLNDKENQINMVMKQHAQILNENNITLQECAEIILHNKDKVWNREINDNDFLNVRVGLGNAPLSITIKAPEEHFTMEDDNLLDNVLQLKDRYTSLNNVPVTIDFIKNKIMAVVCNCPFEQDFLNGLLLQLMTFHSPNDLKIVFLTDKENENKWEYLKVLPHLFSDDKSIRFFATNNEEAKTVLQYLETEFNERLQKISGTSNELDQEFNGKEAFKNYLPYYLVITDNYINIKSNKFITNLLSHPTNFGFSLCLFENLMKNIPNDCTTYAYVVKKTSCVFEKELTSNKQRNFIPDYNPLIDMQRMVSELANIPVAPIKGIQQLPGLVSFLEMFNVGKIEQLNIAHRWKMSNPIVSLSAPIGVNEQGETFKLDLHEKYHGPHGLIAGSTGSGKSEFIITYILSMCINYSPDEVQFVLIDYKGGGLAGAFENKETGVRVPHLIGTITNLDTNEINRSLVSIQSELKRRQKLFNDVRDNLGESTIDIYKYQKLYREGVISEPIAHLFIVSDEFAELKSQQPEFMNQLVQTARIGRSLGVHLILATQKPSGVVNDQIWSNSKFKVCLKVATRSDSMEMLKRPEAASIKEAGRFYLQVGYDELFELGQSAWAGAKYIPTERVIKKIDNSINFINNTGEIIKSVNDVVKRENVPDYGEQLTNIVKYLSLLANKNNIKTRKLWLDSLQDEIIIGNLIKKYNVVQKPYVIDAILGEYDDPSNQTQGLYKINLNKRANIALYGMPGSGKENFISTYINSIVLFHSPSEIYFYILDFGAETLKKYLKYPHVGDVVFIDESEKIINLIMTLQMEIERRKDLFSEYGGSYDSYIAESGEKLPMISVIINSYEAFGENYSRLEDQISALFRDGSKYGIHFLLTSSVASGIRLRIAQIFPNKIALQLPTEMDYRNLLNSGRDLTPANKFGRGLVKVDDNFYEFQTAFLSKLEDMNAYINSLELKFKEKYPEMKAPKIVVLPSVVTKEEIDKSLSLENVSIGIRKSKINTYHYDFEKNIISPIIASTLENEIGFVYGLIDSIQNIPNVKVRVIDMLDIFDTSCSSVPCFKDNFDDLIQKIAIELNNDVTSENKNVFIFLGISKFKQLLSADIKAIYNEVFDKVNEKQNNKFIIMDNYNQFKEIESESWFRNHVDMTSGIWLGDNVGNQMSLKFNNLSLEERKISFRYMAFAVNKGKHTLIKYVVDKERNIDE